VYFVCMTARARFRLRVTSICLLGVAAPVSLPASVAARVDPARCAAMAVWVHALPQVDGAVQVVTAAPLSSVAPRSSRRIFVEDTKPPSSEASETARLQVPTKRCLRLRPAVLASRKSVASDSNRQRAP
jgi:hypothetical protein